MLSFAVALGVIAIAVGRSEAIGCYSCNNKENSRCLDPFNPGGIPYCTGASCTKATEKDGGQTVLYRDCNINVTTTDFCAYVKEVDATICVCSTDYCNDGNLLKPMFEILVLVIAVLVINARG